MLRQCTARLRRTRERKAAVMGSSKVSPDSDETDPLSPESRPEQHSDSEPSPADQVDNDRKTETSKVDVQRTTYTCSCASSGFSYTASATVEPVLHLNRVEDAARVAGGAEAPALEDPPTVAVEERGQDQEQVAHDERKGTIVQLAPRREGTIVATFIKKPSDPLVNILRVMNTLTRVSEGNMPVVGSFSSRHQMVVDGYKNNGQRGQQPRDGLFQRKERDARFTELWKVISKERDRLHQSLQEQGASSSTSTCRRRLAHANQKSLLNQVEDFCVFKLNEMQDLGRAEQGGARDASCTRGYRGGSASASPTTSQLSSSTRSGGMGIKKIKTGRTSRGQLCAPITEETMKKCLAEKLGEGTRWSFFFEKLQAALRRPTDNGNPVNVLGLSSEMRHRFPRRFEGTDDSGQHFRRTRDYWRKM
ncbi:unnamed protein product, partial [Amoebophrya sp. A25]|eukprot:GSA25T00011950001.1